MSYAALLSGNHAFYVGGDSGVGVASFVINSGKINLAGHTTTTTAPAAGGAGALPATPKGYVTIQINGVNQQLAYY
jgi:L-serine deaminase